MKRTGFTENQITVISKEGDMGQAGMLKSTLQLMAKDQPGFSSDCAWSAS